MIEMKKGISFALLLIAFISVNIISATDTPITVQTLPDHKVEIRLLQPNEVYTLIDSFYTSSDIQGIATATLSSDVNNFDIKIWVKKGNDVIISERFNETFNAGSPISLELYPEWYIKQKEIDMEMLAKSSNNSEELGETILDSEEEAIKSDETEKEEVIAKESNNETQGFSLSGLAIFGEGGLLSGKALYYIVGGVLLLVALFFGTQGMLKVRRSRSEGGISSGKRGDDEDFNAELKDAERRIKEAQDEIARIKSKSTVSEKEKKIMEAKKKLIEDQKELMKLREED